MRNKITKKQLWLVTLFAAGTLSTTALYAESVYYVQSVKAKILSGSSFKSTVIAVVEKGHKLTSTGKDGIWVKVKIKDKQGYVPSLLLSAHPPLEKVGVIKADDVEIREGVRRRASSFTSAAAARGLTPEDRKRVSDEELVDFNALERMESLRLTVDEVTQFMAGSKP